MKFYEVKFRENSEKKIVVEAKNEKNKLSDNRKMKVKKTNSCKSKCDANTNAKGFVFSYVYMVK